jgi:hypothetical protein
MKTKLFIYIFRIIQLKYNAVGFGFLCPTIFHIGYGILHNGKAYCRARIVFMIKADE